MNSSTRACAHTCRRPAGAGAQACAVGASADTCGHTEAVLCHGCRAVDVVGRTRARLYVGVTGKKWSQGGGADPDSNPDADTSYIHLQQAIIEHPRCASRCGDTRWTSRYPRLLSQGSPSGGGGRRALDRLGGGPLGIHA